MPHKRLAQSIYDTDYASPGLLFWRAFFNWQKLIRIALEPHNLTQGQYAILAAISFLSSDRSMVSQQDVANQLAMDKMMVSDIVKSLIKKKFIINLNNFSFNACCYNILCYKSKRYLYLNNYNKNYQASG